MTGRLDVVSALTGDGKTTAAEIVAARRRSVHLSIDAVEDFILARDLPSGWKVAVAT